ncbi:CHRNN [Mytilus coruscus]|uniref:CHRNN n=1 Tax=Mytilus coruscus TaxID=42192 RepID=A0A6J8BZJ9_MYTCO|nr:CHRNN [Mytilus coruscus]
MNAENRLHHELLHIRSYSKLIRPTGNDSLKLTVKIGLRLSQLLDIDEKNQIMKTSVWLRQEWTDPRLQWDPKEYQGIKMTHMPSDHLWRPDIVLYNNADGDFVITLLTKAKVYYDGMIIWEPPVIYKSSCPIDVEYFPFDMQECFMKFSSWTYDGQELDLQHVCDSQSIILQTAPNKPKEKLIIGGVDIKDYHQNVEWDIINVTAKRKEKLYPCCPNAPYPYLLFNITLRRRINFRRPATHTMSPWVRRVFTEILPRVLLMRRPDMERMRKRVPLRTCNGIEMRDVRDILSASQAPESTYENIRPNKDLKQYPKEIKEAFEGVISIADHLKTEDQENSEARDWKYIAMVMDRLFLYIFTTACVCGTLSIFLYAPSLYDSRTPLSSNIHNDGACKY